MVEHRRRVQMIAAVSALGACVAALLLSGGAGLAASGPTTSVTIQTMDSCQSALGSAQYVLTDGAGVSITATTPAHTPQTVASGTCALQQGNCATFTTGCAQFAAVPYPGTYHFRETVTPPGNASNPEGYAPCNGGSACRSQVGTIFIDATGTVKGTVLNVYPDNSSATYPIASRHSGITYYAGTPADPIVTHNFGLAPPGYHGAAQCDGDSDADDHSTGTPSSHCRYLPETDEASACQPYPWSCSLGTTSTTTSSTTSSTTSGASTTTGTTTTTTSTTSSGTSTTSTSTSTTSTGSACPTQTTETFTGSAGATSSTSEFVHPKAAGPFTATLTWKPLTGVDLIVYTSSLTVAGQTSGSTGSLSLALNLPLDSSSKVKVKNSGSQAIGFTLSVTHC